VFWAYAAVFGGVTCAGWVACWHRRPSVYHCAPGSLLLSLLRSTPGLHFDRRGDEARREAMGKKGASSEAKKLAKLRAQEAAALIQATLDAAYTAGDPFVDAVKPFAAFERNGITGARCELMCGDTAHDQSIAT
jgi:hypothetical protein